MTSGSATRDMIEDTEQSVVQTIPEALLRFARELARAAINPELIIPRSVSPARRRRHRNLN